MASATSVAARPRLVAFGASFGARLLLPFLGPAFFFAAMVASLLFVAEDDARAALVGEIGPGPVDEHDEPAAESDQEVDVQGQPEPPRQDSGQAQARQLRHGRVTADGGERTPVPVA